MGNCELNLAASVKEFSKKLSEMLQTRSGGAKENNVILKQIIKTAEKKLDRLAKSAPGPNWSRDAILEEAKNIVHTTRADFNALVEISHKMGQMGSLAKGIRQMKAVIRIELNKIFNAKQLSTERFINYVDNVIEDIKTGGKNITGEQANAAKKLVGDAIGRHGDEAIRDYLKSKGIVEDVDSVIMKGLKQGTYTSDQANVTELDLLFKTLKKIENSTQDTVEAGIFGYKRLKNHAFVAKFDSAKASVMAPEDFLAKAYDRKGFIFDLGDSASDDFEKLGVQQQAYMENIYDSLVTGKQGSLDRQTNNLDRLFHDRNLKFRDDAAEAHFYRNFADDSRGFIKDRLTHLSGQLDDIEIRKIVGSDARLWYAQMFNSLEAAMRGKVTPEDIRKLRQGFDDEDLMIALGQGHRFSENMSAIKQISQNYIQAARTPLSSIRQLLYDGSLHTAVVERSFDPKSGMLTGWMRSGASLMKFLIQQGMDKQSIKALGNMLEENGISVHLSRSEAMRRLYDPNLSPFETHKGWLEGIRRYSEKNADAVSRYSLADAVQRATRLNGSVRGGRLLMKMSEADVGAAEFLAHHGFRKGEWDLISKYIARAQHMGKDIVFDVVKGVSDAPEEILKRLSIGAETTQDTANRVNRQIRHAQQTMVDDLGARPTLNTGVNIHTNTKNPFFKLVHSLIFKFQGITLSQQQSLTRAIRRINGVETLDPGVFGSGIGNPLNLIKTGSRKENLMVNLEMLALIGSAGYMIEVGRALASGKTPPEYSPEIVVNSLLNSGALGLPSMIAQNIIHKKDFIGTPLGPEARVGLNMVKGVHKGVTTGRWDSLKAASYNLTKTAVPASSLFLRHNTGFDYTVREWLDLSNQGMKRGLKEHNQDLLFGK